MGEFAKRKTDGQEIKIGTCETMYYLRYDDRHNVEPVQGSLNPGKEFNLFWRLPFPDEDNIKPGEYKDFERGEILKGFKDPETIEDPGYISLKHWENELRVSLKCYHGEKIPEGNEDLKVFWNSTPDNYELVHIKNTENQMRFVVKCLHCRRMWSYEWHEIEEFIPDGELKNRLKAYSD